MHLKVIYIAHHIKKQDYGKIKTVPDWIFMYMNHYYSRWETADHKFETVHETRWGFVGIVVTHHLKTNL